MSDAARRPDDSADRSVGEPRSGGAGEPPAGPPPDAAPAAPATEPPSDAADDERPQVLVLVVGAHAVAIRAELVREVVRPGRVTPLAGAPAWIAGVTAVRGLVLPVADLARRSGAERAAPEDWVVLADGARAAVLAGARAARVVGAVDVEDVEDTDGKGAVDGAVSPAPAGLPVRGAVRPVDGGGGAAPGGVAGPPPERPLPLLDAAALLDLIGD